MPLSIMQPHVILPSQYFKRSESFVPERRLMTAILDDAVRCIERYGCPTDARERRIFFAAKRWLMASETHWPYSFERICAVLDLDANAVRARLLSRQPRARASAPRPRASAA